MKIRLCTIGVPRFKHEGIEVAAVWREFNFAKAPKSARQALIDFAGRLVQIHPDDVPELAKNGLEQYEDGGLRRLRSVADKA